MIIQSREIKTKKIRIMEYNRGLEKVDLLQRASVSKHISLRLQL